MKLTKNKLVKRYVLTLFILIFTVSSFLYFKLRTQYEHQFAICAMFKNEAPYLKEWIDYHHFILNTSKFYLYNNDSNDNYQQVLTPYIQQGIVELIEWESNEEHALRGWLPKGAPWNDYQIGAYNHCIKNKALGKTRWIAMIDVDEFIVPTNGAQSFQSIITKRDRPWPFSSNGSLEIHWKVFGTSNVWDLNPKDMLIEKLYKCSTKDHGWNRNQVKSIYRPEAVDICLIHKIGKMNKRYKRKVLSPQLFNINHYWLGSEKRLIEKRGFSPQEAKQFAEQFNCVEDYTIFQYLDRLKLEKSAAICLIACHGGPADHFATFARALEQKGYGVHVYASGPALKKFQDRHIQIAFEFDVDNLKEEDREEFASKIAKKCSWVSAVLTDVGHEFDIDLQEALKKEAPEVLRLAYYDNPESYVPGGYSTTAARVMLATQKVLFANTHLQTAALYQAIGLEVKLPTQDRIGLGYYPVYQAEKILSKRFHDQKALRAKFFTKYNLEDKGQKILVYFGGNNEEYFQKAFPALLNFLAEGMEQKDLSNFIIILQQHPGAKGKNIDGQLLQNWMKEHGQIIAAPKIIISNETSDDMQVLAEGALYYQTSMGPLFALAGISVIQVGHKTYEDILIKNGLCLSATSSEDFISSIVAIQQKEATDVTKKQIYNGLGIKEDWLSILMQVLNKEE